jgi:hypothetical protein
MSESNTHSEKGEAASSSPNSSELAESQHTGEAFLPAPQADIPSSTTATNNQQSGESAIFIVPAETIDNTPLQQDTSQLLNENSMEVHQPHSHHSRKWKDYLYEFLMLFLAVTAGFFVENKREYYIEHERAAQFSRLLLADLQQDSTMFENRNRDIRSMQQGYDTLIYQLTQKVGATDIEILETLLPLVYVFDFPATATTYNQMKSSGALRYLENGELTAHLQNYYDYWLPRCNRVAQASLDYYAANINPYFLKHLRTQDYDPFNDTLINKKALLMERTHQTDQELANIMGGYRSLLIIQLISMNEPALQKIKQTMIILKREYRLK